MECFTRAKTERRVAAMVAAGAITAALIFSPLDE